MPYQAWYKVGRILLPLKEEEEEEGNEETEENLKNRMRGGGN